MRFLAYILLVTILFGCNDDRERHLVVSKIQSASKLATSESVIEKVIIGTKEKKLLGIITVNQARFVAYSEATVKCGIDLNKLQAKDVKIDGRKIELELPAVEVLDFNYPFDKYVIDSSITKDAFLNNMDVMDHESLYQQAEMDIRNQLAFLGIRKTTERNTRLMIEGLLSNLGYEEIYLSFKEGEFISPINLEYEEQ